MMDTKCFYLLLLLVTYSGCCTFPAVFNFGDSNSDTGAGAEIYDKVHWPNGKSVGKVIGRLSDGLLIIDYIAESLGLPYLNAGVKNGTTFYYGANFAVMGQRINPEPPTNETKKWDYHLDEQVTEFLAFKSRALASNESDIYPKPEAFADALYTIDIGQNDIPHDRTTKPVSTLLQYFTYSIKRLLNDGARYLWVHNTCPFGCLPNALYYCGRDEKFCSRDHFGCIAELNVRSQEFNALLKHTVNQLSVEYPSAVITLVDLYSAKYNLITNSSTDERAELVPNFSWDEQLSPVTITYQPLVFQFCCGTKGMLCGINNTYSCDDPSDYVIWDGIHFTQAANKYLAVQITDGVYSHPYRALSDACDE